jgi:hypothetical protein
MGHNMEQRNGTDKERRKEQEDISLPFIAPSLCSLLFFSFCFFFFVSFLLLSLCFVFIDFFQAGGCPVLLLAT